MNMGEFIDMFGLERANLQRPAGAFPPASVCWTHDSVGRPLNNLLSLLYDVLLRINKIMNFQMF